VYAAGGTGPPGGVAIVWRLRFSSDMSLRLARGVEEGVGNETAGRCTEMEMILLYL
jgi:hypothetical protein